MPETKVEPEMSKRAGGLAMSSEPTLLDALAYLAAKAAEYAAYVVIFGCIFAFWMIT